MANLKNLSIPNISANDTALQLNGNLSFKHLGTNVQHMQILSDTVLDPDLENYTFFQIGSANGIFSNSTSLRFGSLSSNTNVNIRVPAGADSGILFKNTHSGVAATKTLCSFSSYHNGTTMQNIDIETIDTAGRTKIDISSRKSGTLFKYFEMEPDTNITRGNLYFKKNLTFQADIQYKTYLFGTKYTGLGPSGVTDPNWKDLFWPTIVYGKLAAGDYSVTGDWDCAPREIYTSDTDPLFSYLASGGGQGPYTVEVWYRTIQDTCPSADILLHGSTDTLIELYKAYSTDKWQILYSKSSGTLGGKTYNDNSLLFRYGTSPRGFINPTDFGDLIAFTGQHRLKTLEDFNLHENFVGLIVVSAGTYSNIDGSSNSIDEALPTIQLSRTREQKSVIGVISDREDVTSKERIFVFGYLGTILEKHDNEEDTRMYVNSVGEGGIWVTNINGNLENGDYITTCEIPGYGMKQDSEFLHNYTVAKITCDCDFNLESPIYICEEFEYEGIMYKRAFVGCTYHCG